MRFGILVKVFVFALLLELAVALAAQTVPQHVVVDVNAPTTPFPHFWERVFGSGRAILSLRESYRDALRAVKKVTDMQYVRFHAILHDEVGVYSEDKNGSPIYNFSYVDQIYDGLLQNGVRPFVEISFMPRQLALRPQDVHPFWYKQIVSPPKDYAKWDDLIQHFAQHLVDRYGIDEVSQWYFEVWNEPNIDFWSGNPKEETYFELYDHTARALKRVSPRLRVGGPATSSAHWIPAFLEHCAKNKVPVDFVSTHGYADDTVENLFGTHENIPMDERVCRAIKKVHQQIASSPEAGLPLMWTEWNVPSFGELHARDSIYVGAALADDIRQCDGFVEEMSFWTFSDVFEETGVFKEPFHGGFGLITADGIKKPSYDAFALLHQLGDERLQEPSSDVLVTRRKDGTLVLAAWNLVDPDQQGRTISMSLEFRGLTPNAEVRVSRLDSDHENTLAAYDAMGRPQYPTQAQMAQLNQVAKLPSPEQRRLEGNTLDLTLTPDSLVIVTVPR